MHFVGLCGIIKERKVIPTDKQIYLVAPIDEKVFNDLHAVCSSIKPNTHIQLNISSLGGSTHVAISIYNYLKSLPFQITTHNLGEVTSAAVLIYLAGHIRTAEPNSKFLIHPITVHLNEMCSFVKLEKMAAGLSADIKSYADIVNQETDSLKGRCNVEDCLSGRNSITLNRNLAHECGIVTKL